MKREGFEVGEGVVEACGELPWKFEVILIVLEQGS
jgi:hypothetical protein